jgi:prepilin-type N-terminal cleavage/methylation domain-containing protein
MAAQLIMTNTFRRSSTARGEQRGFTLIEVMISVVVLTVGLVSMLAVFGLSLAATQTAQEDMIAKQLAAESLESIFTARDTSQITWSQIQNAANGGIFVDGFTQILDPGPDGLQGTADDLNANPACPGPSKCLISPGPDGILGTADDVYWPLNNYSRQIVIGPLNDASGVQYSSLRSVTITIQYAASTGTKAPKTYVMSAYISQYR